MKSLIQNARHSMRLAQDNAAAHLQFACMFATADMVDAANHRLDKANEESLLADFYQSTLFTLLES